MTEWTLKQKNIFLTLLIGDVNSDGIPNIYQFFRDLTGFQKVKEFMEKEYPDLWDSYIFDICNNLGEYDSYRPDISMLNTILDLNNFIAFMLDHRDEWEWEECPDISLSCYVNCPQLTTEQRKTLVVNACSSSGKIKHYAIEWAEKEGLVKVKKIKEIL